MSRSGAAWRISTRPRVEQDGFREVLTFGDAGGRLQLSASQRPGCRQSLVEERGAANPAGYAHELFQKLRKRAPVGLDLWTKGPRPASEPLHLWKDVSLVLVSTGHDYLRIPRLDSDHHTIVRTRR